jgi:tetratricopeptide (TPR) repeat protein
MSTPAAGSFAVAGPAAAYSPDRAGFDKTTPSATERSAQTKQTAIGLGRALPGMGATLPMVDAASVDMPETQRPSSPVRTSADAAVVSSTAGSARAAMASEDDLHDLALPMGSPARRARFRWIAGLVMVAMFVLVGATVGRRYITELSRPAAPSATPTDQRVSILLREGNRRLAEGDLESAKESFDKASVLGETDPQLRAALARLETVRADLVWLKIRLLDPADMALVEAARKQLADRIGKAESQLANARNSEPSSLDVTRVRLDLLRMRGQLAQARAGVGPLSGHATDPDNAYVLAALDLAETAPVWSSIIERLKSAASAERALGRAQAALVYALTRAGRIADAKMELGKLDAQHPLLAELTAFVRRHETAADAGTGVAVVEAVAASPLPAAGPGAKRASGQEAESAGDFRSKLEQASVALGKGDLNRAEQLYQSVLATHPNSTEALGGLGDVARRRGNSAKAAEYYQRVLDQNPSYLPAMIGLADQKWASGDRKGALVLYRRILDQSGSGSSYGQRAAERIKQAEAAASAPQQAEEPAAPAEQPHIDTTDLPEPTQ